MDANKAKLKLRNLDQTLKRKWKRITHIKRQSYTFNVNNLEVRAITNDKLLCTFNNILY